MYGEFSSAFKVRYQRNNKRTGQKNIRCFPDCSDRGHQSSGFCGRFLTAKISGIRPLAPSETVRTWGYFIQCGGDEDRLPGQVFPLNEASLKERTRSHPLKPWLRGEVSESVNGTFDIVFNRQLLGWHYDWTSTKHTCDAFHAFKANVFILNQDTGFLTLVGSILSQEFQLYSRRRQHQMQEQELAEAAAESALKKMPSTASHFPMSQKELSPRGSNDIKEEAHHIPINSNGGDFSGIKRLAEHAAMQDPSTEFFPKRKRLLTDSNQIKKRRERNLILDRLMRFLLSNGGNPTGYISPMRAPIIDSVPKGSKPNYFDEETETSKLLLPYITDFDCNNSSITTNNNTIGPLDFDLLVETTLEAVPASDRSCTHSERSFEDFSDDEGQDLIEQLEKAIMAKGSSSLKAQCPILVQTIRRLSDAIIGVSSNRKDFNSFFAKWSSHAGIRALKSQFEEERSKSQRLDSFVSADEEDETGAYQSGDANVSESVYASMRNLFRNVMVEALSGLGADLDDFKVPMELAAKYRILNADPYYPPSKRVAAITHLQLNGNLDNFSRQDFGCRRGKFSNEDERQEWVSAYWTVRRKVFRNLLVRRILDERVGVRLPPPSGPMHPALDFSGTWFNCSKLQYSEVLVKIARVMGNAMGDLSARLVESMWKKITITMNRDAMHVQGERVLFANPSNLYLLDCLPHGLKMHYPLPVAAWNLDRRYLAWYDTMDGRYCVHIVTGGHTRADFLNKYLNLTANSNDSTYEEAQRVTNRLDQIKGTAQIRVAKTYFLAEDRETLFISTKMHFFDDESAPEFENVPMIQGLVHPNHVSEVASWDNKYIRVFDEDISPSEVVDLLM